MLNAKAAAVVHDFKIQVYAGGTDQTIQELTSDYSASLQQLGYL